MSIEDWGDEEHEMATLYAPMPDSFSSKHPHEPEIPPVIAEDGHCRICRLLVDFRKEQEWGKSQSVRAESAERRLEEMRKFVDNSMTFYDVQHDTRREVCTEGPNIPALAAVSKRIWYHATDDQTSYPFSAVIAAALARKD